jgi:hypothetical protein
MTDRLLPEDREMEMEAEILPPDYQEWLDSLEVKKPEPEDFNSIDFNWIPF